MPRDRPKCTTVFFFTSAANISSWGGGQKEAENATDVNSNLRQN